VKREEVAALKRLYTFGDLIDRSGKATAPRGFRNALVRSRDARSHPALIAEVKKASPSKGIIRADFDPVWIAERYREGGAACLSVLTDVQFFQGSLEFLQSVRAAVDLPALRKDFMIDRIQLPEARAAGADAILLIAACLDPRHLHDLHHEAAELGMDVLVEIHDADEWEAILKAGNPPPLVGVNNRNLRDFTVSLDVTIGLAPRVIQTGAMLVAESGIFVPSDVAELSAVNALAVLVGESLMRERDPGDAARRLMAT